MDPPTAKINFSKQLHPLEIMARPRVHGDSPAEEYADDWNREDCLELVELFLQSKADEGDTSQVLLITDISWVRAHFESGGWSVASAQAHGKLCETFDALGPSMLGGQLEPGIFSRKFVCIIIL